MKRKITFLLAVIMLLTLVVQPTLLRGQSDVYTSNVTLTTSNGNNASSVNVKLSSNGDAYGAIKLGGGSSSGYAYITVPAGTTKLYVHCAGWNNDGNSRKLNLTTTANGVTITPNNMSLTNDSGISGNSTTFTLNAPSNATTSYFATFTLSGVNSATQIKLATSSKRAVYWGVNAFATVTFNGNGGATSSSATAYTQEIKPGTATALTSNLFTRSGYTFLGWSTTENGDVVYTDGANVTLTGNLTLYAKWNPTLTPSDLTITGSPVTLNFDLYNNSTAQIVSYTTSGTGSVTVDDNDYVTTSVNTGAKTITVTPKSTVTPSAQTITVRQAADATYAAGTATFTVNITNSAPSITISGEGITNNAVSLVYDDEDVHEATVSYQNTSSAEAEVKLYTNAGCTIEFEENWFDAEFSGSVNAIQYMAETNPNNSTRTVYMRVEASINSNVIAITQAAAPTKYDVYFSLDGGSFVSNGDFPTVNNKKVAGEYTLPSATKTNWYFNGWKEGDTENIYAAGASYTVSGDVTFTAQWTKTRTAIYAGTSSSAASTSGITPDGSSITFSNTYNSATQMTSGKTMTLTLKGYSGQRIVGIVLSMRSNGSSGAGSLSVVAGSTTIASVSDDTFNNWPGMTNYTTTYTNVIIPMTNDTYNIGNSQNVVITISASANSLYCQSFSIIYQSSSFPAISAQDVTLDYDDESGEFTYGIVSPNGSSLTPSTETGWIKDLAVDSENSKITFNTTVNNGVKREGTITLTYGDIVKNVKVTQNAQNFTVTYYANGGTGTMDPSSFTYPYGTTVTVKPNVFTHATLTFGGWNTAVDGSGTEYQPNGTFTITANTQLYAQWRTNHTYQLVTSTSQIIPGKHYVIVNSASEGAAKAMGAQSGSIRLTVDIDISETDDIFSFTEVNNIRELVLSGTSTDNYTLYDSKHPGYLCATSSNSNNIGTRSNNSDTESQWQISFDNETNKVTFTAQGEYERKTIRYNPNNGDPRFSCYGTESSQQLVYLYFRVGDTETEYYSPTSITVNNPDADSDPITVLNNEILTLTGTVNCTNAANLVINDGGQLICNSSVLATFKKTMTAPSKVYGWDLISSPVHDGTGTTIAVGNVNNLTNNGAYDMFAYDEDDHMWRTQKEEGGANGFTTLNNGEGYMYRNSGNELSFVGNTNSDAVDVVRDLTYTTGDLAGFHLVGNPYTHSITVKDNVTLLDNGSVALESGKQLSGYYLLTNGGSEWTSELGKTTDIATKQGFLIQIPADAKKIKFSNGAKKDRANADNIMFTVANSQFKDVAYALFDDAFGLNKINHRDADAPMLYINQNGQDFAIAAMSDDTKSFNLNFKAGTIGQYTLSYKADGKFEYLHVIDRLTGEDVDMLLEGEYSFIGHPKDNENRFIVRLAYASDNNDTSNDIFAYQSGSEIYVTGNGELQIFDITGRQVMTTTINGMESISIPNQGVYIFKLNEKVQKIVVR